MTAYKHPITHHWIKQTLVPFLLYAFASTPPYPADISDEIQRSIDFALVKPDHLSDGDDVVFERVFMAIMHRHKNLAPDLSIVVDHLEPCAKYLIRRAQLKGPFELLDRTDVGSSAWVEYEWERLSNLVVERGEAEDELRTPVRPPLAATKLSPTDGDLDPRLVHAQPGHFAAANHSGQLTAAENSYYRQQNRNYEQAHLQRQQQSIYSSAAPAQMNVPSYVLPGRGPSHSRTTSVHESPYSQHQQKIPQQSALPSVYTPQPAINQPTLSVQTNAAAQISGQTQASQPQTLPSSTIITTATLQTYVSKQHAWPQFQPAQFPPAQSKISMQTPQFFSKLPKGAPMLSQMNAQQQPPRLTQTHIPPAQCQPGQQQTSSPGASQQQLGGHQTAQLQDYAPQTYYQSTLPPQPTPPPTVAPNNMPSSDFAHFRGNDWSNAAQQRAREIAAKITAQECDNTAQSIIQRQQSIARQPPSFAFAASMYSPSKQVPQAPPRCHSAMGLSDDRTDRVHASAPSYANASLYAHAPANLPTDINSQYNSTRGTAAIISHSGWGTAWPDSGTHGVRNALPTLERVRSRYHPSQMQSSTIDTAEGSFGRFSNTAPDVQAQAQMHRQEQAEVHAHGQVPQDWLIQQPYTANRSWANGPTDALKQLKDAASVGNGQARQL